VDTIRRVPLWIVWISVLALTLGITNWLFPPYDRLFYAVQTEQPIIVRVALMTGSSPDGCDYPTGNRYGEPFPPLAHAVEINDVGVLKVLLDAGAKPNFLFSDDASPLGMALYTGSEDVIKLLLKYGADPLALTSGGTAISETLADQKHPNKARFLEASLDVSDPGWRARSPLPVPLSCVYGKS
jgi:hypothetical protein